MTAQLSPLSSRAQPRDLQFNGPLLEIVFRPTVASFLHAFTKDMQRGLLRGGWDGKRLAVNTGLDFGNRAIVDRYLRRLPLEHKAMTYP